MLKGKRVRKLGPRVNYQFVSASPEEMDRRLDRAFAVVFEEVMRIRAEKVREQILKKGAAVYRKTY